MSRFQIIVVLFLFFGGLCQWSCTKKQEPALTDCPTWIAKDIGEIQFVGKEEVQFSRIFAPQRATARPFAIDENQFSVEGSSFWCQPPASTCSLVFEWSQLSENQLVLTPINEQSKLAFYHSKRIFHCKTTFSQVQSWDSLFLALYLPGRDSLHLQQEVWLYPDGHLRKQVYYRGQVQAQRTEELAPDFWKPLAEDIASVSSDNFELWQGKSQDAALILFRLFRDGSYIEREGIQAPVYFPSLQSFLMNGFNETNKK